MGLPMVGETPKGNQFAGKRSLETWIKNRGQPDSPYFILERPLFLKKRADQAVPDLSPDLSRGDFWTL
jgi:hypothetical protein